LTRVDRPAPTDTTLPRIKLPPFKPITPEELARRRALFARVIERRERIGPIGVPADDLVHAIRVEADGIED
jgi:hypothetical protein